MGIIVNVIGCETVYILISSSFSPLSYKGGANFGFAPPLSFVVLKSSQKISARHALI